MVLTDQDSIVLEHDSKILQWMLPIFIYYLWRALFMLECVGYVMSAHNIKHCP